MKKNTPKESFGGSELKFNQVKIWNQPIKIPLMTVFFNSIAKNIFVDFVPCHETLFNVAGSYIDIYMKLKLYERLKTGAESVGLEVSG